MLKIFGHPVSTCTRKVLFSLNELGTPFELVTVDIMAGAHKQESHLRQQPFGRIPALDDDGFEMFESRAKGRGKMEQWISVETSEFTPHAMKFIYQYVFKREQEPAVLEAAGKALESCLVVLDKQLGKTPFLAGETFSLADICYAPYIEYAMGSPAKDMFAKHRHFSAWWNKVSERPAWRKTSGKA